jgi:hypothetical protein
MRPCVGRGGLAEICQTEREGFQRLEGVCSCWRGQNDHCGVSQRLWDMDAVERPGSPLVMAEDRYKDPSITSGSLPAVRNAITRECR